jgi:hypothetical protein
VERTVTLWTLNAFVDTAQTIALIILTVAVLRMNRGSR